MFLRSLSIRGFKSFADKTVLEFTPGVSVIVGPNGSGKSNLVDAISWVLGEQGPRALRGGQMAQRQHRQPQAVGGDLAHAGSRMTMTTAFRPRARWAIGSVIRSIPASYAALAAAASMSRPSGIRRSKRPYSISACW